MLPTVLSREMEEGIKAFLHTTFPPSNQTFEDTLETFLNEPGRVFKGPYFTLRLPFRAAPPGPLPFEKVTFPFLPPHLHQARAFERLCGDQPKSTLVATGTGSGKTECFLFPILDACAAHAGEPGIKAILIYPMNALATDQAKRLAQAVYADKALRGKVTAGLFIGGEGTQTIEMTPESIITDRNHLREHPPDILLTNYKMLDYLLLRPKEQSLWRYNKPETLRFLVVDELHTFDGAQSTDLACLIRRLKARLRAPAGHLCCVGTSATLGSNSARAPLLGYATTVFAESFSEEAIIGEDLLTLDDVCAGRDVRFAGLPDPDTPLLKPSEAAANPARYLATQYRLWFDENLPADFDKERGRLILGERLLEHRLFRLLLSLVEKSARKIISENAIAHELARIEPSLAQTEKAQPVIDSFLALCAHALYRSPDSQYAVPLVRTHVHLWTRELARLVASVADAPRMAFSDDLKGDAARNHLPVLHCRECGAMGWGGTMRANDEKVSPNLKEFYSAFFNRMPIVRFFFPVHSDEGPQQGEFTHQLCGHCLTVNGTDAAACAACGSKDQLVRVRFDRTKRRDDVTKADVTCPYCESSSGLTIMGSRSASLTSVALSQLYTSPFNQDKRALAFSDNVQDASHRAGFFAARTYLTNLRTAIRRVIGTTRHDMTLDELEKNFLQFWKEKLGEQDFVGLFAAPNMEWLEDLELLKKEGRIPAGSSLPRLVERRTAWEITSQFGFNSRIGRTLEKSGAAIAYPVPEGIRMAVARLSSSLRERAGGFGRASIGELNTLVYGLLHRLRIGGGIYHRELQPYLNDPGNLFLLSRENHMPSFGRAGSAPCFFYQSQSRIQRFERLVAGGTNLSWSQRWAIKCLTSIPNLTAESAAIVIEEAVNLLTSEGVLREENPRGHRIWGIPQDRILISPDVKLLACDTCGHNLSCAPAELSAWESAPCLRIACRGGKYHARPVAGDYFGDLYRSGDVIRIQTAEHTGLLDRETREWVENRFMAVDPERRITDPNLLSCTPTLEMGVNIGDLSSVILCTVPPETANYVQRIGRAGRRHGAAVSLTIASAQAHDLYYFELPEDMIAGEIRPPGTYLDAPAVLERQLTAFCMDCWSEQANPKPNLPPRLEAVLDAVKNPKGDEAFPYDFFAFVEQNNKALQTAFFDLFAEQDLPSSSREELRRFAEGEGGSSGGLCEKILHRLTRIAEERDDLRRRMQKVGEAIRKNRAAVPQDDATKKELSDLQQYRDGIYGMMKQINDKLTLNFFTDEGLLPNYAFPEEGVELRSIILKTRKSQENGGRKFDALSFEYMRPASSGITELAPGNVFYAEGRKLKIDQVGLGLSGSIESWHFCSDCGYMERLTGAGNSHDACPACKSARWVDASLKRDLVRLRQVVSTCLDRNSRSHDEKDQRDPVFYNPYESVVIPDDAERRAFQLRDAEIPFGFEFLTKCTLRVINLGQSDGSTPPFRIGGRDVNAAGFTLCPECGKVQYRKLEDGSRELKHDIACRYRNNADAAPLKAVFLYRELQSEAIQILLPSSSANEDVALTSFVAALHLGMRLHFRGNIDHLHSCIDERPVPGTSMRRKYLVLYDQVPGGTGYLKQLSQSPETFLDVLHKALNHLLACSCASNEDHTTDGCHRCILRSRYRGNNENLSRTVAIHLLSKILEAVPKLEQVSRVSDIDIHPLIKSELERLFIESLRAVPGAQLQARIVKGRPGYVWRCGDSAWQIGPQVAVSTGNGVSVASVPDFVFYPVRPTASRPIAVFLDGFAFHADENSGHNRISHDVQQRQALLHSGQYWVWSFSWDDINCRNNPDKIQQTRWGEENSARRNEVLAPQVFAPPELAWARSAGTLSNWNLFLELLGTPDITRWENLSYIYALSLPAQLLPLSLESTEAAIASLASAPSDIPMLTRAEPPDGYGGVYAKQGNRLVALCVATKRGISSRDPAETFVRLRFDDDEGTGEANFANDWRGFLRLMNRLQFLPACHIITTRGCKQGAFGRGVDDYRFFCSGGRIAAPAPSRIEASKDEWTDPAIADALQKVKEANLPNPEIAFELMEHDRIVATAEAAWPGAQCALLYAENNEDIAAFQRNGWRVIQFNESGIEDQEVASLLSFLRK